MNFTFLKATGEVAFFRSDAEQAEWTQHEMSLLCSFPFRADKNIERGMTILFQDPATDAWQAYYVRNCSVYGADAYQQINAESLAITELSVCHITDDIQLTNITAANALRQILSGTGWSVGNSGDNGISLGDIGRGSVWQGISDVQSNWNIHVRPRVTVNADGIAGRYLDIVPAEGEFQGLRISIDKNTSDPCVTYDDSELYTALYGYGASYSKGEGDQRQTLETDFSGVAWQKTADHPAKPSGQKYLEYPEMTAMYGLNGRARFGYYQNSDIKDAGTLLQKTWESLKICCHPKVSFTGTVADLRRFGYADQPLQLYDMVIVDLEPFGIMLYKQVIQLTVNLLDPDKNTPTIGDYIPNIIYINRETEDYATGGGKGRGGGTRSKRKKGEFETNIFQNERNINLNAKQIKEHGETLRQAGMEIDPITGVLIYAEDTENMIGSKFRVQSNRITSEITDRKNEDRELSSRIQQTADKLTLEVSERKGADSNLSSRITVTAREIRQEVTDVDNRLGSRITETAEAITAEVTRASGAEGQLSSRISANAEEISAEVTRASNAESSISGRVTVNSNKVAIVVEEKNGNYVVKAAEIVTAINNGESSILLSADHVRISGSTTISGSLDIDDGNLVVKKSAVFRGSVTLSTPLSSIQAPKYVVPSTGTIQFVGTETGENYNLTTTILKGMVKSFSVEDNVLTLTPFYGDPVNFSKATTLTGAWGSGDDAEKFIVTASPQGNKYKYAPPMRLNGSAAASNFSAEITETVGSSTSAKKSIYGHLIFNDSTSTSYVDVNTKNDGTGDTVARISVGSLYTDGQTNGRNGVTLNRGSWSGNEVTISKSAGTTSNVYIRLSLTGHWGNPQTEISQGVYEDANKYYYTIKDYGTQTQAGEACGSEATLDASARYSAGQTDAGVTYDTSTHKVSRAKSSSTKEYTIEMYTANQWSNGTRVIEARIGSDAINTATITAPSVTVTFDCTDLNDPSYDYNDPDKYNGKKVTATAAHGTTSLGSAEQAIWLTAGNNWSNGRAAINARMTNSSGKLISRAWISAPSPTRRNSAAQSSASGNNAGTISGASAGKYIWFSVGGTDYYFQLT